MAENPQRWTRYWDRHADRYDRQMAFCDRRFFGASREWACSRASGDVLEVAVGTGLNLPLYRADARLTGVDISTGMLGVARDRSERLGREITLEQADAQQLPCEDASFDTVVCTLGLCAVPDVDAAVDEMVRTLRPGGRLVLLDHVVSSNVALRGLQRAVEVVSVPLAGEHYRRRPVEGVRARGLVVEERDRFSAGLIERLAARKPSVEDRREG